LVFTPENYLTVKNTAEQTGLHQNTVYYYLTHKLIKGAYKFADTHWVIPVQWVEDYLLGKISLKGAFAGKYKGPEKQRKYRRKRKKKESQ
jgi:hypothetical protein